MGRVPRPAAVVIELGLFIVVLGLPDGALGVIWPSLRHTFGRPVGDLGVLALAGTIPYLVASTGIGQVVRRVGFGSMASAVACLAAAATAAWATAPTWPLIVIAVAFFGFSRGAVDSAFNAYISEHEGVRRLGLLHAGYGVGATLAPLLVAVVLSAGAGWRLAIGALAVFNAVLAVATTAARHGWRAPVPTAPHGPDEPTSAWTDGLGLIVTFVIYTAAEAGIGSWAFVVSTDGRHLARGLSAAAVACYWGMLTSGRLLLAAIGGRMRREHVLVGGSALAIAGLTAFWLDHSVLGLVGLGLSGLGFAATFPILVSLVPDYVGDRRSAHVIGLCVAAAAVGGPVGTALGGRVADAAHLKAVPPLYLGLAVALLACVGLLTHAHGAPD